MNMNAYRPLLLLVSLICSVILLSSCNGFAGAMRKVTYPPDFLYISEVQLRSKIYQLAAQLSVLETTLAGDDSGAVNQQQKTLDILGEIERVGGELKATESGSNHPFLEDYMGDFVSTVTRARIAASLTPPRYYLSGRVSGACTNSHEVNRRND